MDPPSKFPASPGMPIFPVSPERVAGTRPPYNGPTPSSPSIEALRTSPVRGMGHRRNDSDVSVHGLAAMFENLEVKDFKEAQARYLKSLDKQKAKHAAIIKDMETRHAHALSRHELRMEELADELKRAKEASKDTIAKSDWDKLREEYRQRESELVNQRNEQRTRRKQLETRHESLKAHLKAIEGKASEYQDKWRKANNDCLKLSGKIPELQADLRSAQHNMHAAQSKAEQQERIAEKYKHEVYNLEVNFASMEASLKEELKKMEEKVKLVEEERDSLKTTLKEEEVLRMAAEGRIALPAPAVDDEEFGTPVRSPRKQRNNMREDDKENVAPKKSSVELKMLQKELEVEKTLRERAEEQIHFMKMECQFQCCSCRIADLKGSHYVHDNSYSAEMERIKQTIPVITPPPSHNGEHMDVIVKDEPVDVQMHDVPEAETQLPRPMTPPVEVEAPGPTTPPAEEHEEVGESADEPAVAFSPTTGTFRSVPSPQKAADVPEPAEAAPPSRPGLSRITEATVESSPWAPAVESTVLRATESPPPFRTVSRQQLAIAYTIPIHEDAIEDSDDEEEEESDLPTPSEPQTPLHGPSGPAQFFTRTITTTTTIPLHFSPMTPHVNKADHPLTPSTIAHMPTNTSSNVLTDLSLNKLPIDREAALEQIRQRRGRARSMAAGQGTPRKQMLEGVGLAGRRDISAPVGKLRR